MHLLIKLFQRGLPGVLDTAATVTNVRLHMPEYSESSYEKKMREDFYDGEPQSLRW